MKILLQGRVDVLKKMGGDSTLMMNLARELKLRKIHCYINDTQTLALSKFDIVHFFGIMRIHDLYPYFLQARKYHKKIIVTPIYENLNLLDNYGRVGWEGLFANILPNDLKELGKGFLRAAKDKKQLKSAFLQFIVPYSKQQKNGLQIITLKASAIFWMNLSLTEDAGAVKLLINHENLNYNSK